MEKVCKRETGRTYKNKSAAEVRILRVFSAAHEYEMSAVQEREAESKPFFNTSQRRSPEYLMNERKVREWGGGQEGLRKAISSASPSHPLFFPWEHSLFLATWTAYFHLGGRVISHN